MSDEERVMYAEITEQISFIEFYKLIRDTKKIKEQVDKNMQEFREELTEVKKNIEY